MTALQQIGNFASAKTEQQHQTSDIRPLSGQQTRTRRNTDYQAEDKVGRICVSKDFNTTKYLGNVRSKIFRCVYVCIILKYHAINATAFTSELLPLLALTTRCNGLAPFKPQFEISAKSTRASDCCFQPTVRMHSLPVETK